MSGRILQEISYLINLLNNYAFGYDTSKVFDSTCSRLYISRLPLTFIHSLLNYHIPTHSLRSANTNLLCTFLVFALHLPLVVSVFEPAPKRLHTLYGIALAVWNSLPSGIRDSSSRPLPIPSVAFLKLTAASGFWLPLAAHPSASDSASGWHCAL